jgi:hypothetical protein
MAAYVVGIVLTAGLAPADATHHTGIALGAFAAAAAIIGLNARPAAAPVIAVIAWLFFDGFLINRHAHLTWDPHADPTRLAILTASAFFASLLAMAMERVFGNTGEPT